MTSRNIAKLASKQLRKAKKRAVRRVAGSDLAQALRHRTRKRTNGRRTPKR